MIGRFKKHARYLYTCVRVNWSGLTLLQVIYFCKCNRPKFGFDDYHHKRNHHNRLVLSDWLCHIDILNCTAWLPAYMTKTFMAKSFGNNAIFVRFWSQTSYTPILLCQLLPRNFIPGERQDSPALLSSSYLILKPLIALNVPSFRFFR